MKNKTRNKLIILTFLVIVFLITFDQFTKQLAVKYLMHQEDYPILPGILELHYLENTGAAFSIMNQNMMWFFYIITPILCLCILYVVYKIGFRKKYRLLYWTLIVLFSGAIGNYIDRILHQYVIDFIYLSCIRFPVFNVADIYVTISVVLLFLCILFIYKEEDLNEIGIFKHENNR